MGRGNTPAWAKVTDERLLEAIAEGHGNLHRIAQLVRMSVSQVSRRIRAVQELTEAAREAYAVSYRSYVRSRLMDKIDEGDLRAITFWLEHNDPDFKSSVAVDMSVSAEKRLSDEELEKRLATVASALKKTLHKSKRLA